jgi:tRNA threonylcarbamoyladenosine modification (KEOPS) complex  Pcc1 subunit
MVKPTRAKANLKLAFKNNDEAEVVRKALKPEEILPASERCKVRVARRKNVLCLEIDAKDTAGLRAAVNSFLRWIMVARDMIEIGRE